jgi:hypothetical protein
MAGPVPDRFGDPSPGRRRGGVPWGWVAMGAAGALVVVVILQAVLALFFGLIRLAFIGVAVAAIAWLVIIGPPSRRR